MTDIRGLYFGKGNSKVDSETLTFSLPAGHTCPGAFLCKTAVGEDGKLIEGGKPGGFRCFAATEELHRPSVKLSRERNLRALRDVASEAAMFGLLYGALARHPNADKVRVHASGDFFSAAYFRAWMRVAAAREDILFYAYTKSLDIWVGNKGVVPDNFILTASYGGIHDALIEDHKLKSSRVVWHPAEAALLGLEIDHDDKLAMAPGVSFALLLHSMQPRDSDASRALRKMKKEGVDYGYPRK